MLAILESLAAKVWKTPEQKATWTAPPTIVEVRIFSGGVLETARNVPVPFFMTCQELFAFLGLYFCRTLKIKLSLLQCNGDVDREIAPKDAARRVKDIVRHIKSPTFFVEVLSPRIFASSPLSASPPVNPDKLVALTEFEEFSFSEQIDQLWKLSKASGEPFQGLNELARALHDGYFPAHPAPFIACSIN